jgi:hypothetical protein
VTPAINTAIRNANPRGFRNASFEHVLFAHAERLMDLDIARGWRDEIALLVPHVGDLVTITGELVRSRSLEVLPPFPPPDGELALVFVNADDLDDTGACNARTREVFRSDASGHLEGEHGDPVLRSGDRLRVIVEIIRERGREGHKGLLTYKTETAALYLPRIEHKCSKCGRPF